MQIILLLFYILLGIVGYVRHKKSPSTFTSKWGTNYQFQMVN